MLLSQLAVCFWDADSLTDCNLFDFSCANGDPMAPNYCISIPTWAINHKRSWSIWTSRDRKVISRAILIIHYYTDRSGTDWQVNDSTRIDTDYVSPLLLTHSHIRQLQSSSRWCIHFKFIFLKIVDSNILKWFISGTSITGNYSKTCFCKCNRIPSFPIIVSFNISPLLPSDYQNQKLWGSRCCLWYNR